MEKLRILQFCLHCIFCLIAIGHCQLLPSGKNVQTKYRYFYVSEKTNTRYIKGRRTCTSTCSSWFLGWCIRYRRVCKTVYSQALKTKYKRVQKRSPIYSCKPGWLAKGRECLTPVCTGGCRNGGKCIAPNSCHCTPGWRGSLCNGDVNECATSQNKCGYKPGCRNTHGSYTCNCASGYYLKKDLRNCEDIDECIAGNYSCGANSRCVNVPGNYSCPCLNGFGTFTPSNLCEDIDECNPSSGYVHGCKMKCNNFVGGYRCSCNRGYNLTSNGKDCSDHDECNGNAHGCEQRCINLPGGYTCSCLNGYRLSTEDAKTCDDINECLENISGCAHYCTNTIGGFNCSCKKGYRLGIDQTSCIDIDECSKPVDYCHHICSNTPGSYKCTCREGFDLRLDGKSCIGRPCFPIHKPVNGIKNCTGYRTEEGCNFGCLRGYNLIGSVNRTCGSNKQWTGKDTKCKIIHCANPKRPSNGFVYSPCATHYGSKCSLGCNDGYRIDTDVISCDANGLWQPTNVSCKEIEVCRPNPCFHKGRCSIVNEHSYKCDCSNTGYKGTSCEVAFFTIFNYPTIYANVLSPPITILASQPTDQVILHLISRNLEFTPSVLVFNGNSSLNQSITVKAKEEGLYFIKYSLSGTSAGEYLLPEEDTLFVRSLKNSNDTLQMEGNILNFPAGCHKKQVGVVFGSKLPIVVSSTSPFVSFGPLSVTQGVVGIEISNSTKLPLSLVGVNLPNTSITSYPTACVDSDAVPYSTGSLLKSRVLAKSFIDAIENSLPTWIKVTLSEANSVKTMYSSEKKTYFVTGTNMRKASIGKGLPVVDKSFFSILSTNKLNITVKNDSDIFNSKPIALAVELDGKNPSNILLRSSSEEEAMRNISILRQIEKFGWIFEFYSLQISKNSSIKRQAKKGFWDGDKFFDVESSSDGTFAAVTSLKKHFKNTTFAADLRMEFDGTIIGHVEDINKILDSPLYQKWDVDLYGRITLTIVFQIEGKTVNLRFKGQESVNNAIFGDKSEKHQGKRGFFLTTFVEKDPFFNTSLGKFLDMSSNRTISCFVDTALYKKKHNFHHVEISAGLSCAFRGVLRVGGLQFQSMQLNLLLGTPLRIKIKAENTNKSTDDNVQLIGTFAESKYEKFGIFKRYPDGCMDVRFTFSQHSNNFVGSFCAISNILGVEELLNVSISYERLKFKTSGKLHGLFDATMDCSSRLLPWENQIFEVVGRFERNEDGTDFVAALKKELTSFAKNIIARASKRIEAVNETVKQAHARLDKVLLLKAKALDKLQQLNTEYTSASENLRIAQNRLKSVETQAKNYSKDLDQLKSDLDGMCKIKTCRKVCHKGISCTTCYEYIIGDSKGTCPATCFHTKQQLVPPFSEVAYCIRENCKRIHSTNGFFKMVFGEKFAGLVKSGFSMGISLLATSLGAPPPLAGAIAGGITALVDTGRVDDVFCGAIRGAHTGKITKLAIKCQRKQEDGKWNCKDERVQCVKGRYEYEYTRTPYICKQPCVIERISKKIEKSCCRNVSCASFAVNVTCVAVNVLCKKARVDALQEISKTQLEGATILKNLEYAKSNRSFWNMKKQRTYSVLTREQRWLNTTEKAAKNLEKAYNKAIESKDNLVSMLSAPLGIKSLFNTKLNSVDGIEFKEIRFETKVLGKDDSKLLPIVILFQANGTLRHISTVLDFSQLNVSLKSISEEILFDIIGNIYSQSRKRRSADTPMFELDPLLHSLKKYHAYCANFKNYHGMLYNVAMSLYKLSSEIRSVEKELSQSEKTSFNLTNLLELSKFASNQTASSNFTLDDPEMSEAFELELEEKRKNYEDFNSTNKLLVQNWFVAMESMFNSSRLHYECSGMKDCMQHILDSLVQMFSVVETDRARHIRRLIQSLDVALDDLSNSFDISITTSLNVSSKILNILEEMKELEDVCAQSPNITRHPDPVTEMRVGRDLVLHCNATGAALIYSWTFNGEIIPDKKSNVLILKNATTTNSGNYTCVVSNHIAKERSISAVVTIYHPPIITVQSARYLAFVIGEHNELQCKVKENVKLVSREWWFKPANSLSFEVLSNETFSYLGFSPMQRKHEGWYFCRVSNAYGLTSSRVSFVKALSFTLPVPSAVLSFSLIKKTNQGNSSVTESSGFEAIQHLILSKMSSLGFNGDGIRVRNLQPIDCQLGRSENDTEAVGICSWKFQCVGVNMTTNNTVYNEFKANAERVVNATESLNERIRGLVRATNNGSLFFSVTGNMYVAEKNSIAVHKFSLLCPKYQVLFQRDFKCVDCPPGYHAVLNDEEIASCIPCPLGFYQSESGKASCYQCPKGFTTWNAGSYDHSQCIEIPSSKVITTIATNGDVTKKDATTNDATTTKDSATKAVFDDEKSPTQLIIGLSLGGFFLILFVIGVGLLLSRWKYLFIPKKGKKLKGETWELQDNPAIVSSFTNVIYDGESSKTDENVMSKDVDDQFHSSRGDMENGECSESRIECEAK